MSEEKADIHAMRSIAEIITSAPMHPLKRWILRKLIPADLWELPAQELIKLQKGAVIASVVITTAEAV